MISTHAPTRGATRVQLANTHTHFIFLLTPLREGRLEIAPTINSGLLNFYSRPYARGDLDIFPVDSRDRAISTHAPTRGATRIKSTTCFRDLPFLLTPLREGRPVQCFSKCCHCGNFYSRPYARGDPRRSIIISISKKFLLTPLREGRRRNLRCLHLFCGISTHAPTRGATR